MDGNSEDMAAVTEDEVTIVDLALFLEQNMKLIGALILATLIAALAYVLIKTPIYSVSALLEPVAPAEAGAPPGGNLNALAAVAGINLGSSATDPADRSLAVIQSHEFLASFQLRRPLRLGRGGATV